MGSMGWMEIGLILLVIVLLFGARKLPELGRGLGEGIRSFKDAIKGGDSEPADKKSKPSGSEQ